MPLLDIFKRKKREDRFVAKEKKKQETAQKQTESQEKKEPFKALDDKASRFASILKPHTTEKTMNLASGGRGVYVFKVGSKVNRIMVKQYVKDAYKVTPTKVNIINTAPWPIFLRRRKTTKPGYKKALVYLKKGEE